MLRGRYVHNNFAYDLVGYDFGVSIGLYLSAPLMDAKKEVDAGIVIPDPEFGDLVYEPDWNRLYLSVGSGFVRCSCYTKENGGQVYKNRVNGNFLARLGGIISGMISSCTVMTRVESMDEMVGAFVPELKNEYHIGVKGIVRLSMHTLEYLEYSGDGDYLLLENIAGADEQVVRDTRTQHKFALDVSEFVEFFSSKTLDSDDWDFSDDRIYSISEIIERNPNKSYVWLKDRKYRIVSDFDEMVAVCKEIWAHDGIVSFDTETTGLNFNFLCRYGEGDRLVGMVFSIRSGESWYFPVAHKKIKNICTPENENYIITKYFKPILEQKPILCQNGSFDWKVMYGYDIFLNLRHDTYILAHVTLWNDHRGLSLGLKEMTETFLGRSSFELSDFVSGKWGKNNVKFWDLDEESVTYYACPDTDNALDLYNLFINDMGLLEKYGAAKTYEIEVAFSIVIAYQEYYGHTVDVTRVESLAKDIERDRINAYNAMTDIVGHNFNPRSSKDIIEVAFNELKLPVLGKTNTGNPSMDKNVRKSLLKERNPDGSYTYPFVKYLDDYLIASQLESNFVKNIDKFSTKDGYMFSEVNQFLETGRVSCSNPNYQSYSDVVKKYIVPREGYYAMDSDYSSIEYRILACMSGQENLIERFFDPDMDYHTYQASRMFGVPYELVTKELRSNAKGINFGIPYGMGDESLGKRLFGEKTPENTVKAKKMRRLYFEGQEKVEQFFIKARADGVKNLWSDTFFGRRRYFDPGRKNKGSIEREAGNNRIQGTAADIYKIAMVRLLAKIRKEGLLGKVLISAFVHDECFLEIHKSIDPAKMLKMVHECLMLNIKGWCPLYIGAGFGTNWYDAKKTEIPIQVQDIIIDTWGDTGLDWWKGDTEELFYWEVGMINDYKRDRVIDYLKNEDNWNKVFSPVENGFAHEVLDELNAGRHIDGVVNKDVKSCKDMIENLEQFCIAFGCEDLFEKANIQHPAEQESKVDLTADEEEEEKEVEDPMNLVKMRVNQLGLSFFGTGTGKKLYFRYDENNPALMKVLYKVFSRNQGNIEVRAIKNDEEYETGIKVGTKAYSEALPYYLMARNVAGRS